MRSVSSINKSAQTTAFIVLSMAGLVIPSFWNAPAFAKAAKTTSHHFQKSGQQKTKAQDAISSLHVDITVRHDASLDIVETIDANFVQPHHGIERFIPLRTKVQGISRQIIVDLHRDAITCDGYTVPTEVSYPGGEIKLKIGKADTVLTGTHKYKLSYVVRNAISESKGRPELYWNAVGTEWKQPISNATATVHFPAGTISGALKSTAFRGVKGSKQPVAVTRGTDINFQVSALRPGEGLTLAVQMPEHTVEIPNKISLWLFGLQQTLTIGAALAFAAIGMGWLAIPLFCLFFWRQSNIEPLEWTSSGGSALDFGSVGDALGGGGGDCW